MNWTTAQQNAISMKGNLLVSAAAGSGKTAVLTERIVNLIAGGADIDDFLVVTFTKAAAEEMKKRIERRLRVCAEEADDNALKLCLRNQAQKTSAASISTIHAFCTRLLRKNFGAIGLDPAFRAAADAEAALMRTEAKNDALEMLCGIKPDEAHLAISALGGEKRFLEAADSIIFAMSAMPDPDDWLDRAMSAYALTASELNASPASNALLLYAKRLAAMLIYELERLINVTYEQFAEVRELLTCDLNICKYLFEAESLSELTQRYGAVSFARMPRSINTKTYWSFAEHEGFKKRRDDIKKSVKRLGDKIHISPALAAQLHSKLYPAVLFLKEYIHLFYQLYDEKKHSAGVIDYNDMEHLTLKLLSDDDIANSLKQRIRYIFVDEYQDSNRVQEAIISRITSGDNLFLVGDVKQSIYRFRQADPTLFLRRYELYREKQGGLSIDLNANFRSCGAIIDAVNLVFENVMRKDRYEIEYDEAARLKLGRTGAENLGNAQIMILDKHDDGGDEAREDAEDSDIELFEPDDEFDLSRDEAEALFALLEIRRVLKSEQFEDPKTGQKRPYRYEDIAILVRSNSTAMTVVRTLALEGVPAYSGQTGGYMDSLEVQTLMNLLRVIDNSRQDIPLISVMHSEIGGFDTKELSKIRAKLKKAPFIEAALKMSEEDSELGRKTRLFLDMLSRLSDNHNLLSVEELMGKLLDETDFYRLVRALPGGEKRVLNIDSLIESAHFLAASRRLDLHSFIEYYDVLRETSGAYSGAAPMGGIDAVRVMTIHKSKGLEFPFVILLNAGKSFVAPTFGEKSSALCHADVGIGLCHYDSLYNTKEKSLFYIAAEGLERMQGLSEELRLLYVAMTRAVERLYIIGTVNNLIKKAESWTNDTISSDAVRCQLDFLMPAIMAGSGANELKKRLDMPVTDFSASPITVSADIKSSAKLSGAAVSETEFDSVLSDLDTLMMPEFSYEHTAASKTPSKLTVSELSGGASFDFDAAPAFIKEKRPFTAAEKGTITHRLIQCLSIREHDEASLAHEISLLTQKGIFTQKEADALELMGILKLTRSPLWKRICASTDVRRELRFNYNAKARDYLDTEYEGTFLLQGMIDCCFLENGSWVLVDFKTDHITGDAKSAAMAHKKQLSLYADALLAMTNTPVSRSYVYLLSIGEAVDVGD